MEKTEVKNMKSGKINVKELSTEEWERKWGEIENELVKAGFTVIGDIDNGMSDIYSPDGSNVLVYTHSVTTVHINKKKHGTIKYISVIASEGSFVKLIFNTPRIGSAVF